ncbi:Uncharacterised protein [Clostridioides difficile]|nr:Uncharacterised protein [Clostridioides difficile]
MYEIGYKPASSIVIIAITVCIGSPTIRILAIEIIVPIHVIRDKGIGNA